MWAIQRQHLKNWNLTFISQENSRFHWFKERQNICDNTYAQRFAKLNSKVWSNKMHICLKHIVGTETKTHNTVLHLLHVTFNILHASAVKCCEWTVCIKKENTDVQLVNIHALSFKMTGYWQRWQKYSHSFAVTCKWLSVLYIQQCNKSYHDMLRSWCFLKWLSFSHSMYSQMNLLTFHLWYWWWEFLCKKRSHVTLMYYTCNASQENTAV